MNYNHCELNILVKGRRVDQYKSPMDFQTYIEGRHGSDFELEFINHYKTDVEVIFSIDGLSVTDGKPAGTSSSGYIVKSKGKLIVPGWLVDGSTAAKFTFSGNKGDSYVEKINGDASNKGIIGIKVFSKKEISPVWRSYNNSGIKCSASAGNNSLYASAAAASATPALGTEFGASTDFNTTKVEFQRDELIAVMVMYYDDANGLRRKGIDVSDRTTKPTAFPADLVGATPPVGWTR